MLVKESPAGYANNVICLCPYALVFLLPESPGQMSPTLKTDTQPSDSPKPFANRSIQWSSIVVPEFWENGCRIFRCLIMEASWRKKNNIVLKNAAHTNERFPYHDVKTNLFFNVIFRSSLNMICWKVSRYSCHSRRSADGHLLCNIFLDVSDVSNSGVFVNVKYPVWLPRCRSNLMPTGTPSVNMD